MKLNILWIYTVLLVVGGIMGWAKAKSKISLISSIAFAIPLAACALNLLPFLVAEVLQGLLILVFAARYAKGRKFMPAGMMILLSVAALVAQRLVP